MINEPQKAADLKFTDIRVGSEYSFKKTISSLDVISFAKLTGDFNPLHVNSKYGKNSIFKQNIAHGMLVGSLFSTIVGMYCPGKKCLYLSQQLEFIKPVFFNQEVVIKGIVVGKSNAFKVLTIKTEALVSGKVVIRGEARVKVLG